VPDDSFSATSGQDPWLDAHHKAIAHIAKKSYKLTSCLASGARATYAWSSLVAHWRARIR
jgi:hypothetical protein